MAKLQSLRTILASILALVLCIQCVKCEMFTAMADLKNVLYAESDVAQDLRGYIAREEERLDALRRLADDFEAHSAGVLEGGDVEAQMANPVLAFLLVKRFTSDWNKYVNNYIRVNNSEEFLDRLQSRTHYFPTDEDLQGTATALFRLQDTYALSVEEMASGKIKGVKYSPELSADEIFTIGVHAYNRNDYYHTLLWMEQALKVQQEEEMNDLWGPRRAAILDYLSYVVAQQGNIKDALELTEEWLQLEPDHIRAQNNVKYYKEMLDTEEAEKKKKGDTEDVDMQADQEPEFKNERPLDEYRRTQEFANYEALCRGEDTKPNPVFNKLTCQYRRHKPMFYIRPLKEETMFLDPRIVVYHEVMTDTEIAKVKELATPKLGRSGVFVHKGDRSNEIVQLSKYRVSKTAWLKDAEDVLINQISQRTSGFTNLTLDTVEELQVVNYGIGGHYEPHYDFARPTEKNTFEDWRGNRVLTAIFYMTDVAAGGATVFPELGVKLWPEKGACAVWHNLYRNGEGDYRTRHAGCPVLTGSKWVCNKWFHDRGQEFVRPCALDQNI